MFSKIYLKKYLIVRKELFRISGNVYIPALTYVIKKIISCDNLKLNKLRLCGWFAKKFRHTTEVRSTVLEVTEF